jgi:VWFA-related protein
MKLLVAIALVWMVLVPGVWAQTVEPPASGSAEVGATTTLSTRSTLVLVPALVRDKAGKLVYTLKADDFVLTDNGVPQKLRLEQDTGGEPLALVVVVQGGGRAEGKLETYKNIAPLIETVVGDVPHKVAVVGFDSSPVLVQDFTPETDKAAQGVLALIQDDNGDGGAAILDSVGFAVDLLRKQPKEYRRAILLFSETIDHGSKMKMKDALRAISDTNTVVYSVSFSTGKSDMGETWDEVKGAPPSGGLSIMPEVQLAVQAMMTAIDALRRNTPKTISRLTGGEYFPMSDAKSLGRDLQTVANHIPNRYVLSFQPQSPIPGFHAIKLKVPAYDKLTVSARDGYWADEDAAAAVAP